MKRATLTSSPPSPTGPLIDLRTSRSIRSSATSVRSHFNSVISMVESPCIPSRSARSLATKLHQAARNDSELSGHLGDRLIGIPDDPHRPFPKLPVELPAIADMHILIVHACTLSRITERRPRSARLL
jgi:hypothetical protein